MNHLRAYADVPAGIARCPGSVPATALNHSRV